MTKLSFQWFLWVVFTFSIWSVFIHIENVGCELQEEIDELKDEMLYYEKQFYKHGFLE